MPLKDNKKYREWKRKNYRKNREKEIERKRKYRKTKQGKATMKKYYEKIKNTVSYRARVKVSSAIRRGKLIKGLCEKCGDKNVQAHHNDYNKPLEVIWLCKKCHSAYEREHK